MTIHLPVLFPEDKKHVSFSEINTWIDCSWRHKLKYLQRINLDTPSKFTEFGQVMHDMFEIYLKTKRMPSVEETVESLNKLFDQLGLKEETDVPIKEWRDTIKPISEEFVNLLETEFKNWEFFGAELSLFESIETSTLSFKGFIDAVIKVPRSSRLKTGKPDEFDFYILDYKTTSWGWDTKKKRDPKKIMQLAFYKHFLHKKFDIPLGSIKCGFVILKRTAKDGKRVEFYQVSIGDKVIESALEYIGKLERSVKKQIFVKDRDSCKYCPYDKTEHCT